MASRGVLLLLLAAIAGGSPALHAGGVDYQAFEAYAAYKQGDYARAHALWRERADAGSTSAMINLANMYASGQGVERDPERAFTWFRQAAEAGDPVAQTHLGVALERGEGVARNNHEAARWFRRAAQQDDAEAQRNLGVMLATNYGKGLEHSSNEQREEALHWLERAAAGGNREANALMGTLRKLMEQ